MTSDRRPASGHSCRLPAPTAMATAFPEIVHTISAETASGTEGGGTLSFIVTRSGNIGVPSTVNWVVGGTVDAADFGGKLPVGRVSFAAGEFVKAIVLRPTDDSLVEEDETLTVSLAALTGNGAVHGTPRVASMTLKDNDIPPTVSIASAQASEGGPGETRSISFTLTRTGNLSAATDVVWTFSPWSSTLTPEDFPGGKFPTEAKVTFAPGMATLVVAIPIAGDAVIEGDEDFVVTIVATRLGQNGDTRAVGTILSDDTDNRFDVVADTAVVTEGDSGSQWLSFSISRSGNDQAPVQLKWHLIGSVNAADLAAGTLTDGLLDFAAGETSKTLRFELTGDLRTELDETLGLRLVSASGLGAGLGERPEAITTITTDDPRHPVTVATATAQATEGAEGALVTHRFTVSRSGDLSEAAQIHWSLGGTVDSEDFVPGTALAGTIAFAPGAATALVDFTSRGDSLFEGDETLVFSLGEGDLLAPDASRGSASVLLRNDDLADEFLVSAATPVLAEGSVAGAKTAFRFDLVRTGHVDTDATVQYAVSGSGVNPADAADFGGALPAGTMKWFAGETRKTLYISASQDALAEFDEGFTLTLSNGVGAGVSATQGRASVLLKSDELPGPRSITGSPTVNERYTLPGPRADFQLSLEPGSDRIRVVDSDPGRSGTLLLADVDLLRFSDGTQWPLKPVAPVQMLLWLGQALRGPAGLDGVLFEQGLQILAADGERGLCVAAAALLGPMPAQAMAQTVLGNLGVTPASLGGGSTGDSAWRETRALLGTLFEGDSAQRGLALQTLLPVFTGLEADATYGAAATAFNDRTGHEWLAEFAGHPAMLVGLPETVVDLGPNG